MNTPSSREADRIALAAQVAAFTGQIEVLQSFPERPTYRQRTDWIDPESIPKRKAVPLRRVECPSEKMSRQRAIRQRGRQLLREEWPELDALKLSRDHGVRVTTLLYRLGNGETLNQAIRGGTK